MKAVPVIFLDFKIQKKKKRENWIFFGETYFDIFRISPKFGEIFFSRLKDIFYIGK